MMQTFAARNRKELLRDPFSLLFGVGLPVFLLLIISLMQTKIEVDIFAIDRFAPGIAMFSFSFVSMFSGMLIARDRCSSFLARLFASPLSAADFLLGYSLPLLPLAMAQGAACFLTAFCLGLSFGVNALVSLLTLIPAAAVFIGMGLVLGSLLTDKQVGGVFALLIQVVAFSSGMWFDLEMMGGAFETIAYLLPFAHALKAAQSAMIGEFSGIPFHLLWCVGYAALFFTLATLLFKRKMRGA